MKGIKKATRYLVSQLFQLVVASLFGVVIVMETIPQVIKKYYIEKEKLQEPSPVGQVIYHGYPRYSDPLANQIEAE